MRSHESNEFRAEEEKCGPGSTQGEIPDRQVLGRIELVVAQYCPASKSLDQVMLCGTVEGCSK